MKKILLGCSVGLVLICFGFSACGYTEPDIETDAKISALQTVCNELQAELEKISGENKELKQKIDLLNAQIDNLSGNPVTFTEETPNCTKRENEIEIVKFDHHSDATVSFDGFLRYCRENLKPDYECWLLSPIDHADDFHPNMTREYSVTAEKMENGVPVNPMICERIMMYSEVLGDGQAHPEGVDGSVPWSLYCDILISPVKNQSDSVNRDIRVKFGEIAGEDWDGYANLYIGNQQSEPYYTPLATCYYKTNAYVSEKWLLKYFENHFIRI